MEKCLFRSSNNECGKSTSEHHCKVVRVGDCFNCLVRQDKPTVSDRTKFRNAIMLALAALPSSIDNREGKEILYKVLEI